MSEIIPYDEQKSLTDLFNAHVEVYEGIQPCIRASRNLELLLLELSDEDTKIATIYRKGANEHNQYPGRVIPVGETTRLNRENGLDHPVRFFAEKDAETVSLGAMAEIDGWWVGVPVMSFGVDEYGGCRSAALLPIDSRHTAVDGELGTIVSDEAQPALLKDGAVITDQQLIQSAYDVLRAGSTPQVHELLKTLGAQQWLEEFAFNWHRARLESVNYDNEFYQEYYQVAQDQLTANINSHFNGRWPNKKPFIISEWSTSDESQAAHLDRDQFQLVGSYREGQRIISLKYAQKNLSNLEVELCRWEIANDDDAPYRLVTNLDFAHTPEAKAAIYRAHAELDVRELVTVERRHDRLGMHHVASVLEEAFADEDIVDLLTDAHTFEYGSDWVHEVNQIGLLEALFADIDTDDHQAILARLGSLMNVMELVNHGNPEFRNSWVELTDYSNRAAADRVLSAAIHHVKKVLGHERWQVLDIGPTRSTNSNSPRSFLSRLYGVRTLVDAPFSDVFRGSYDMWGSIVGEHDSINSVRLAKPTNIDGLSRQLGFVTVVGGSTRFEVSDEKRFAKHEKHQTQSGVRYANVVEVTGRTEYGRIPFDHRAVSSRHRSQWLKPYQRLVERAQTRILYRGSEVESGVRVVKL